MTTQSNATTEDGHYQEEGPRVFAKLEAVVESGLNPVTVPQGTEFKASPETLDNLGVGFPPPPTDPDLYVWVKKASFGRILLNDPSVGTVAFLENFTVTTRRVRRPLVTPRIELRLDCNIVSINRITPRPFVAWFHFMKSDGITVVYTWDVSMDLRCSDHGRPFSASEHEYSYMSWYPDYTILSVSFHDVWSLKCS